jgi:hypothetical protein
MKNQAVQTKSIHAVINQQNTINAVAETETLGRLPLFKFHAADKKSVASKNLFKRIRKQQNKCTIHSARRSIIIRWHSVSRSPVVSIVLHNKLATGNSYKPGQITRQFTNRSFDEFGDSVIEPTILSPNFTEIGSFRNIAVCSQCVTL